MNSADRNPSLGEAASSFLASLAVEEREISQQEVYKFVRWFGQTQTFASISAPGVDNYATRLSSSDTDYVRKLGLIRAFLVYAHKKGWSKINLATHLKTKKGKPRVKVQVRRNPPPRIVSLTRQGHADLEDELAVLKGKRSQAIEEIRKAAADKDFRENAPLEAAREQHGQLEGRIKELEEVLKTAVVLNEKKESALKVNTGDSIVLRDLTSEEELRYIIVSPKEVDPTKGKISRVSPIGEAVIGCGPGDIVEVTVPVGKLRYRIEQIER
ncbi:GreA/GreB family elongation factor [Chloroflexota bacterium]